MKKQVILHEVIQQAFNEHVSFLPNSVINAVLKHNMHSVIDAILKHKIRSPKRQKVEQKIINIEHIKFNSNNCILYKYKLDSM